MFDLNHCKIELEVWVEILSCWKIQSSPSKISQRKANDSHVFLDIVFRVLPIPMNAGTLTIKKKIAPYPYLYRTTSILSTKIYSLVLFGDPANSMQTHYRHLNSIFLRCWIWHSAIYHEMTYAVWPTACNRVSLWCGFNNRAIFTFLMHPDSKILLWIYFFFSNFIFNLRKFSQFRPSVSFSAGLHGN